MLIDLIALKEFASDKKVERLFSYKIVKLYYDSLISERAILKLEQISALFTIIFFLWLHLHAINSKSTHAK